MKRIVAFSFLNIALHLALFSQSDDLKKIIKDLSYKELTNVKAIYSDCISKPNNCYGDSLFLKTWLDGLENETINNLDRAVDFYYKAIKINRFELSTYEVMYSLGRTEILRGNTKKGIEILNGFVKKANSEQNDENSMWGFSEEGLKEVKQKIENSKQLILKCQ